VFWIYLCVACGFMESLKDMGAKTSGNQTFFRGRVRCKLSILLMVNGKKWDAKLDK